MTSLLKENAPRFWSKVDTQGPLMPGMRTRCWPWKAGKSSAGYGQFKLNGVQIGAHVVAWEEANGPVPLGKELDHVCRLRSCVRPSHLEPVTCKENLHRSPLTLASIQSKKTYCPKGHPYDAENTYITKKGLRMCRACGRERMRKRRHP